MSIKVDLCLFQAITNIDRKFSFFLILNSSTCSHKKDITFNNNVLKIRRKTLVRICVSLLLQLLFLNLEIAHFKLLYCVSLLFFALRIEVKYNSFFFFFS